MSRVRREYEATTGRAHRPDRTFADVAEDWLRDGELKRGLKRSTLRDYRQVLEAYLLPAFGELPVSRRDGRGNRAMAFGVPPLPDCRESADGAAGNPGLRGSPRLGRRERGSER